ncbi:MAG TPA: DUF4190 domain-containing protein [Planctomycetes bacterium]|nr:DUF4190 domain-containing protein [Planctomycetota bacterium]
MRPVLPPGMLGRSGRLRHVRMRKRPFAGQRNSCSAAPGGLGRHENVPGMRRDDQGDRPALPLLRDQLRHRRPADRSRLESQGDEGRRGPGFAQDGGYALRVERAGLPGADRGHCGHGDTVAQATTAGQAGAGLRRPGVFSHRAFRGIFDLDGAVPFLFRLEGSAGRLSEAERVVRAATEREAGVHCPHCDATIIVGQTLVDCPSCGAVHHAACWGEHGGCGTYQCAPARRQLEPNVQPAIRITAADVDRAVPLPKPQSHSTPPPILPPARQPEPAERNGLAVAAFVVALAGIVLFGPVTGLVAIVLGALALGAIHQKGQRGMALAVAAVLLGVVDVAGWVVALAFLLGRGGPRLAEVDFEPDPSVLENLSPEISRAMRANVLIETRHGWRRLGARGIGSGVIVRIGDRTATIVTNRHVVDPGFTDGQEGSDELPEPGFVGVKVIGQPVMPGTVVWVAPHGIDLAVLHAPIDTDEAKAAVWQRHPKLAPGDTVFSIGNPQGLGWTHTRGTISQIRVRRRGGRAMSVIQTDTPINPGNSGGGLYDEEGRLVGINTWTNDKRFSEGLSFALAFQSLLQLNPPFPAEPAGDDEPADR